MDIENIIMSIIIIVYMAYFLLSDPMGVWRK